MRKSLYYLVFEDFAIYSIREEMREHQNFITLYLSMLLIMVHIFHLIRN